MMDIEAPRLTPLRIAGIYTVVGLVWVVGSDWVVGELVASRALERVATVGFVLASGVLVFALTQESHDRRRERGHRRAESVSEMESVLDVSPHPVVQLDTEGRILRWNDAAESVFGWAEDEVLGEQPPFVDGDEPEEYEENVARVAAGDAITHREITRERKDGSSITVDLSAVPVHDQSGNVASIMAMLVDVSEYKSQQTLLEDLLSAGEYIMAATTREAVCERTVDAATTAGPVGAVGIWIVDDDAERLVPEASRGDTGVGDQPVIEAETSVAWDVFQTGEARAISALPDDDVLAKFGHASGPKLVVALGDNGVLIVDDTQSGGLDELDFHLIRVLGSFADAAFERIERETELIAERKFIDTAIDALDDIFVVIDPDTGEIVRGNQRLEEVIPGTGDGFEDLTIEDLIAAEDIAATNDAIDAVMERGDAEVEIGIETGDGTVIEHEFRGQRLEAGGRGPYVVAIGRDVSDQRQLERALRENERRYRTLVEMSPLSIVVHVDGELVYANDAFLELVDADEEGTVLGTRVSEYVVADERGQMEETAAATQSGRVTPSQNRYTLALDDEAVRHVETTSRPIAYDGQAAVLTFIEDITQRVDHEDRVRSLHDITRDLLETETTLAAMTLAARSCAELLDLPEAVVFVYEADAGRLAPSVATEAQEEYLDAVETIEPGSQHPVWNAFVANEPDRFTESTAILPFQNGIVLPLGTYGVLVAGSTVPEGVDEETFELAEILRENLLATLQRLDREETLAERDRELAVRNEELEQLTRVEGIIRTVNRALIKSRTREEIETTVCSELVDSAVFSGAWIAEQSPPDTQVSVVTWRGIDVDDIPDAPVDDPIVNLVETAREEGQVTVATEILNDPAWTDRRAHALDTGYSAVAAVPIPVHGDVERVLVVHARDSDLFTERTSEVFTELGQLLGTALETVGRRQSVGATTFTRLELAVEDSAFVFNRLVDATDGQFELRGAIPTEDGINLFLSASVSPESVQAAVAGWTDVTFVQRGGDSAGDDDALLVLSVAEPLFEILSGLKARVREIWTDAPGTTVTVDVPDGVAVREVMDALGDTYTGITLQAKTARPHSVESPETTIATVEAACTERQLEALRAAYYGGYYEWPRKATNEALAETLGISSATYQSHRRTAERKLVETLLE